MRRVRMLAPIAVVALLVGAGSALAEPAAPAAPPLSTPGDTSRISLIASTTAAGWTYRTYRNDAYPCSISGYQTFTVGTASGTAGRTEPLWVYLHGGGVGYFDSTGAPQPNTGNMTEESPQQQITSIQDRVITQRLLGAEPGTRVLAVSMCNRELYGGVGVADPNNPNTTPDGATRTTNGLLATKAAVQFTTSMQPTDDVVLYGGSAGSYGTFHVGLGLQQQGLAPAGIVADSGIMNVGWLEVTQPLADCGRDEEALDIIQRRMHPSITATSSGPDRAVASGVLTVPILQIWSIGDPGQCGTQPVRCPLPGGTIVTMGSVDCMHEPMRRVIEAQGPASRSANLRLCVTVQGSSRECGRHVPTGYDGVNTLPGAPADYNGAVVRWVQQRLADD